MKLDSMSNLHDLVSKLETNNKLYETGKAYWFGYNDLMFSIAVYADKAIEPLVTFIKSTDSYESKLAALLTLHLIGIDCKIAGRTYEEFSNQKAREALISLLATNSTLQDEIELLLVRDPRASDIPQLFSILDTSKTDCWAISSGLLRYDLKNIPVAQDVPSELLERQIAFSTSENIPSDVMIIKTLQLLSQQYSDIEVEDTLYSYKYEIPIRMGIDHNAVSLAYLIYLCRLTNYCFIGPNFQYSFVDGKMHFCSSTTTKRLWLDWWKSQDSAYKDSLRMSYKKIGKNRM